MDETAAQTMIEDAFPRYINVCGDMVPVEELKKWLLDSRKRSQPPGEGK